LCSIAGFISSKPLAKYLAERLCAALLYHGSNRGSQSTGMYVNDKILKKAKDPMDFIWSDEFTNMFDKRPNCALLHTRQPTCGGLGDAQAQPFKVRDTIAIHNGWFVNCDELKDKWNIRKKSGVDSELVAQFIQTYGIRMLPKFLETTHGSSAIAAFYNEELYLIRQGNPTAYTIVDTADGNTVFVFASTGRIISDSVRYCWLLPSSHPIKETKEGYLFRVSPGKLERMSARISKSYYGRIWSGEGWGDDIDIQSAIDDKFLHELSKSSEENFPNRVRYPESPHFSPTMRKPIYD